MAFTLNLTTKADVDDSVVQEFDAEFRIALAEMGSAAQFATLKRDFQAESISLPKYDQLTLATTPLVETDDVTSEALVDSKVLITPQEYGNVVTTTKLASITTKGMADRGAARLVGINAGRTDNKLAILAMDASTNVLYGGDATSAATIEAGDDMDASIMALAYNKLAAANAVGLSGGDYFLLCHDNVAHSLREQSGANTWQDAHKYAIPENLMTNEIGKYKGIRVVIDNLATIEAGAGVGGIDVYSSYFVGFNALGKGVSHPTEMRATGPFDKLSRFVNLGWYGVQNYKIVEQDALWIAKTSVAV